MSLRWRKNGHGDLLCAATSEPEKDDIYFDDDVQYLLSVELGVIVPDENEAENGQWYFVKTQYAINGKRNQSKQALKAQIMRLEFVR